MAKAFGNFQPSESGIRMAQRSRYKQTERYCKQLGLDFKNGNVFKEGSKKPMKVIVCKDLDVHTNRNKEKNILFVGALDNDTKIFSNLVDYKNGR